MICREAVLCWPLGLAIVSAFRVTHVPRPFEPGRIAVPWKTGNTRVNELVEALTPDEKLSLVHGSMNPGTQNFADYSDDVGRLGIPALNLADGEAGVNAVADATMLPSQLNVGATFSRAIAYQHGAVGGKEARLLNASVLLAPRVNILRDPFTGNFWQSYSEDPYLNAELGTRGVWGIQDQGTMPAAKQIGASSTGASRGDINSQVDLQVLHEVYLAAHEALVKADVPIVICSSTMVNGEPVCESDEILYETLRGDWNFTGIVMSDKGGDERFTTSTAASQIMAGLDWDYGPSSSYRYALKEAIYERKTVSESYLNRTVHRILSIYDKVGLLDGKGSQGRYAGPLLDTKDLPQDVVEQHGYSAFEIAVRSAVLLKNFNKTLPVSKDANIAVIGPSGLQLTSGAGYGERAFGIRSRKISPWDALQTASPNREVKRAVGVDTHGIVVPAWALRTFDGRPGIRRDDTEGNTVVDPVLNFAGDTALPAGIGFDWTGQILAPEAGFYRIAVQRYYPSTGSRIGNDPAYERIADSGLGTIQWTIDDVGFLKSMRLRGDGGLRPWGAAIPTLDNWDEVGIDLNLTAGWHNLSIGVPPLFKGDKTQVRLAWTPPVGRRARIEEAVKLAAEVDVPIVFAHAESPAQVGMQLLQGHDELIAAVAKANKNTVVVLHNAEPVLMPWLDDVAAVLWMGHPGQEGGRAVADLLMGASSPQGRLPVTYPASVATSLTRSPAQPERVNTTTGTAVFSEGINSGYRWYLASQTKTLFPFGYGLSYTEFEYKNLQLTVKRNEGEEVGIEVSVDVSNVGTVLGNVVPQLYIGPPKEADRDYKGIQFPVTKLVGFNNVEIRPGQMIPSKHYVSARQLSFWNPATRTWEVAKGTRQIWVGANAESRILVGEVTL